MSKSPDEIVEEALAEPKSATVDGVNVQAHPLKDQIEAAKYLAAQKAAAKSHRGIRFTKLIPGGSVRQ